MTDDSKCRFDALGRLRDAAWGAFNARRSYEWKMCFTIWTGVAAFIWLQASFPLRIPAGMLFLATSCVLLLHIFWQVSLKKRNDEDIRVARELEARMRELCGLAPTDEQASWWLRWCRGKWSHGVFVSITVLLLGLALYMCFYKSGVECSCDVFTVIAILLPFVFVLGFVVAVVLLRKYGGITIRIGHRSRGT